MKMRTYGVALLSNVGLTVCVGAGPLHRGEVPYLVP